MVGRRMLRDRAAALTAGALIAAIACLAAGGAASAASGAHVAKRSTLRVTETASLSLVRKNGATLYERGTASGTLPGSVTARFNTSNLAKTTGTVTFYPSGGGTLTVSVVAYPQSTGTVARFSGNLAVSSGTGRFARALGSGTLSGTVNRRTWAVTVNARATLTY